VLSSLDIMYIYTIKQIKKKQNEQNQQHQTGYINKIYRMQSYEWRIYQGYDGKTFELLGL